MAEVLVTGTGPLRSIFKQITFAAAQGLTEVAKQGQSASVGAIETTFTTRGRWYLPGNRYGVRVTPATKETLESSVRSAADWLQLHETAGTKKPRGAHIAVPTRNVRRSPRQIIPTRQRPQNLKRAFRIDVRPGTSEATRRRRRKGQTPFAARAGREGLQVLFQRTGRGRRDIRAMYVLIPRAHIRKESTLVEVVKRVVGRRFAPVFEVKLRKALETAK